MGKKIKIKTERKKMSAKDIASLLRCLNPYGDECKWQVESEDLFGNFCSAPPHVPAHKKCPEMPKTLRDEKTKSISYVPYLVPKVVIIRIAKEIRTSMACVIDYAVHELITRKPPFQKTNKFLKLWNERIGKVTESIAKGLKLRSKRRRQR